ncbi:MAG: ompA family protein [Gammaproteobacteria bacterium]|nr:ompA family protein [Gammaproteobacteria bacterium]
MEVIVSSASVRLRRTLHALVGGMILTLSTLTAVASDVPGSKDHPLLSRFAGAGINDYSHSDFDEAVLPNQPIDDQSTAKGLNLEGKVTRIGYTIFAEARRSHGAGPDQHLPRSAHAPHCQGHRLTLARGL